MPRYFFAIDDGEVSSADDEGVEFDSLEDVRTAAIKVLPSIADAVLPDGDHHTVVVVVTEEDGRAIFRASLALTAEWLIDPFEQNR